MMHSGFSPMNGAAGLQGRRAAARLRVRLPVRLVLLTETMNGVLADLSQSGARIALPRPVDERLEAMLLWGRFEAFGTIAWSAGRLCGMTFDEPIDGNVLIATRRLDDAARLPEDRELVRRSARSFVQGVVRL